MIRNMDAGDCTDMPAEEPGSIFGIPRDPHLDRQLRDDLIKIRDAERRAERETAAIRLR